MQQVRFEGSLLASLHELKAIEEQRLADERAAVARAELLRQQELADAERRRRDDAEARARAAHEAELALERARVEAEREARLRVEAAEAAERARHQAALDQARLAEEVALRREEVARKRPTWMVAVTVLALAAAGALTYVAVDSRHGATVADNRRQVAEQRAAAAQAEAERARVVLEGIERQNQTLDGQIRDAIARVASLQDRAELEAANARLRELRRQKADAAKRAAEARREAERKKRLAGQTVSEECQHNAVCRQ